MDWFKKWFPDQNTEKRTEKEYIHKDLDTRVSYRYPTLPPEFEGNQVDEKRLEEVRERLRRIRKSEIHQNHPVQETFNINKDEQRHRKTSLENKYVDRTREKSLPEKELSVRKKPFRPTEVPSPIYGYRKRRQPNEQVEVELTGLSVGEEEKTEWKEPDQIPTPFQKETIIPSIVPAESGHSMLEHQPSTGEKAEDIFLGKEFHEVSFDSVEKGKDIEKSLIQEKEGSPTELQQSLESNGQGSSAEKSHFSEREVEKRLENDSLPSRKRRGPLPFNVLMLKQDRQRLEQRRKMLQEKQLVEDKIQREEKVEEIQQQSSIEKKDPEGYIEGQILEKEDPRTNLLLHAHSNYVYPPVSLLHAPVSMQVDEEWIARQVAILDETLENFHVGAKVVGVTVGPTVTRFEISPDPGVKVNKITNLSDDLKLRLAARDIRIEAPIPGKHTVGIEVPNQKPRPVLLREIIEHPAFQEAKSPLTIALGLDIGGKPIVTDLGKMPHGLIAGATGSGKSVCINSIIVSLLYKAEPEQVKLLLIDPKMVELAPYNEIPHLISPVITNAKAATQALKWAVEEMERRYELFAANGSRNLETYNKTNPPLPLIVIIIDELADLMMVAPNDVEESIARIAQKARAAGIHLLVATQRPSVDVITGLIKANIPTRIAFSVSSQVDSRTILDASGAERLLGRGDMLFLDNGTAKPVRVQGCFISDEEIDQVVEHVRKGGEPQYLFEQEDLVKKAEELSDEDELLIDACRLAVQQGTISTSSLQRHFRIGYNRAARLIDFMEERGMITPSRGSKPRDVLITEVDIDQMEENSTNG